MPTSPFSGTQMVKLIDPNLVDFGTKDNPIFIRYAVADVLGIKSIVDVGANAGQRIVIPGVAEKRICVFALSIFLNISGTVVNFTDNLNGTVLFSVNAEATNQVNFSFSESIALPSYLFSTSAGNDLAISVSVSANSTTNISYFLN